MAQSAATHANNPTDASTVRVAVVDDHESVRLGLKAAFIDEGYEFVLAAPTVQELIDGLGGRQVDVVVLDLSLGDGVHRYRQCQAGPGHGRGWCWCTPSPIEWPVSGRLSPRVRPASSLSPRRPRPFSPLRPPSLAARSLNNLEWATAIDADRDFAKAQLGRREREILHLYASGLPLKLAAQQLGIGYSTAREYLDRIRVKYVEVGRPAPTKVDLLRRAVEDGILPGLDPDGGDAR